MRTSLVCFVSLALSVAACGKGAPSKEQGTPSSQAPAPTVVAKPLATLFTDKAPTIPAVYKGITIGMPMEEAKKLVPTAGDKPVDAPEFVGSRFWVNVSQDKKHVESFRISFPAAEGEKAFAAWGAPKLGKDMIDKPQSFWFNPAAKIRARVTPGFSDKSNDLTLEAYTPMAEFLGDKGETLGFESKQPLVGATLEQLRAAYPKTLIEQSQAMADDNRKGMEAMMGKDKDKLKVLGAAMPSVYLDFPPTDYGSSFTRVNLNFDDKRKVKSFWTGIAYRDLPESKPAILESLKAKLGAFKEGKEYGRFGDPVMKFGKTGDIMVKDDTILKAWEIKVGKR